MADLPRTGRDPAAMLCPKCGYKQPEEAYCVSCGITIADFEAHFTSPAGSGRPSSDHRGEVAVSSAASSAKKLGTQLATRLKSASTARLPLQFPLNAQSRHDLYTALAELLEAGVDPDEALELLVAASTGGLQQNLVRIAAHRKPGKSLSQALAAAPALFTKADVAAIELNEPHGATPAVLHALADRSAERHDLYQQLLRGLVIPIFVLVSYAVLAPLPRMLSATGPGYTEAVLGNLTLLGVVTLGIIAGLMLVLRLRTINRVVRALLWRLPWPATIALHHLRAVFYRVLARNNRAGLDPATLLTSCGKLLGDEELARRLAASTQVAGSQPISGRLAQTKLPAPADTLLLVAGEKVGRLSGMLFRLGRRSSERRRRSLRLLLVLATAVLFVVVSSAAFGDLLEAYGSLTQGVDELLNLDPNSPLLDGMPELPRFAP